MIDFDINPDDKSDEIDNPVVELIQESMSLFGEYMKLFLENQKLKGQLERFIGGKTFNFVINDENYEVVVMKR